MAKNSAVIYTLQNPTSRDVLLLQYAIRQMRAQTESAYIALGLFHCPQLTSQDFPEVDQIVYVEGEKNLLQREAVRNAVVCAVPASIPNLVFLDFDVFPKEPDWLERVGKQLLSYPVVLPFSMVLGTDDAGCAHSTPLITAYELLGDFPDPLLTWGRDCAPDAALAMQRALWTEIGQLPWRDGFTGCNYVHDHLMGDLNRTTIAPQYLGYSEHRPMEKNSQGKYKGLKVGFIPRKLYRFFPGERGEKYGNRVRTVCDERVNLADDVRLNLTGGIELTEKGMRHRSMLEGFAQTKPQRFVQPHVEFIKVKELTAFAEDLLSRASAIDLVPLSLKRAKAHELNPFALPDDIGLMLGYLGKRCVSYFGLVPGRLQSKGKIYPVSYISTAFVFHHLKPTGVSLVLAEALKERELNIAAEETEPAVRQWGESVHADKLPSLKINSFARLQRNSRASFFRFENITRSPELFPEFNPSQSTCFHRNSETLSWMLSHPWCAKLSDRHSNYYFDRLDGEVTHFIYRVGYRASQSWGALIVFSIKQINSISPRVLKILIISYINPQFREVLVDMVWEIATEMGAELVETTEDLAAKDEDSTSYFSQVSVKTRRYFLRRTAKLQAVTSVELQQFQPHPMDGDGAFL